MIVFFMVVSPLGLYVMCFDEFIVEKRNAKLGYAYVKMGKVSGF